MKIKDKDVYRLSLFSLLLFAVTTFITACGDENNRVINSTAEAFRINKGVVTNFAGLSGVKGDTNGVGTEAEFNIPFGITIDTFGNLYIADSGNNLIRKITAKGSVTTLAGLAGVEGYADGAGSSALFDGPFGIAADKNGNLYVTDTGNSLIRKIDPDGVVSTLAGSAGVTGCANGIGAFATFNNPWGIAVDASGTLYVADASNGMIRKISPNGIVTTLAGQLNTGDANATGIFASFKGPKGVAVDTAGNVYVADQGNDLIRKITAEGVVTTLAGRPGVPGSANGKGVSATFYWPSGVAVDSLENVYVADWGNDLIRKITPGGMVTTLAGSAGVVGSANGIKSTALFYYPEGIAVDTSGNLYITDMGNNLIRKIQ